MSEAVIKSVRGKRTLYFAGWNTRNHRKPRFTPNKRDAAYLSLSSAHTVRDNLTDAFTTVTILTGTPPLNLCPEAKGKKFRSRKALLAYMAAA